MATKTKINRATAERVRKEIADLLKVPEAELFLADHTHENLRPGSWSIALEGWTGEDPWPLVAVAWLRSYFPNLYFEPLSSWGLGIYPAR